MDPYITPLMVYRLAAGEGMKYQWRPLEKIAPCLQQAVIAAEDQKFRSHFGFDFDQIDKAIADREKNKKLRGASTITMQTARNLFLWQGHSWIRKILEAYYTALIEIFWDKWRIMEVYLNIIEWGNGIFGAEASAQAYFKSPASALDEYQAAIMAATLPNPRKLTPVSPTRYLLKRQDHIINLMEKFPPLMKK